MKWRQPTAREKGLDKHLISKGVTPATIRNLFGAGYNNKEISQKTGHSEHAIGRWKKLWSEEQRAGLDALNNIAKQQKD